MAEPYDWYNNGIQGFVDIRTGRTFDPFPVEIKESMINSLEPPTEKCAEGELDLNMPCIYETNRIDCRPNGTLPIPDIEGNRDCEETTSKTSINLDRQITRSTNSSKKCFKTREEMAYSFERKQHKYKNKRYRERSWLLVFCVLFTPLILANVAEGSSINDNVEEMVLICKSNGTNTISCKENKSRQLDVEKSNGTSQQSFDVEDSHCSNKRGVVCPLGQVYHCTKNMRNGIMEAGCAKPIQCAKGSFPQLYRDEKKQNYVQCVMCDPDHYQPYLIDSFIDKVVLKPRISMELRKELDKMVLVKNRWPYGPDKYACNTKQGYSNILRQHLCDVISPCICTKSMNCSLEHGLELLPDSTCDKICIGERDPMNQFKCIGLLPEIEISLAYIASWFTIVAVMLMVCMSAIFGDLGIRLQYMKKCTTHDTSETVEENVKWKFTCCNVSRKRFKDKRKFKKKYKHIKREMPEIEDMKKYSMIKADEDKRDCTMNNRSDIRYTNTDIPGIVQSTVGVVKCIGEESCKNDSEYLRENRTRKDDEVHDSGIDLHDKDLECLDKIESYIENTKQEDDDDDDDDDGDDDEDELKSDKEILEKKPECERSKATDEDKKVTNSDFDPKIKSEITTDKEEKNLGDEAFYKQPIQESIKEPSKDSIYNTEGFCRPIRGVYQSPKQGSDTVSSVEAQLMKDNERNFCVCHCYVHYQDTNLGVDNTEPLPDLQKCQKIAENREVKRTSLQEYTFVAESGFDTRITLTENGGRDSDKDASNIHDHQHYFLESQTESNGYLSGRCELEGNSVRSEDLFDNGEDNNINYFNYDFHKLSVQDTNAEDTSDSSIHTQMISLKTFCEVSENENFEQMNIDNNVKIENNDCESGKRKGTNLDFDWDGLSTETPDSSISCKQSLLREEQSESNSSSESEFVNKEVMQFEKKPKDETPESNFSPMISYSSGYPLDDKDESEYCKSNDSIISDRDCKSHDYSYTPRRDVPASDVPQENISSVESGVFTSEMLRCIEEYVNRSQIHLQLSKINHNNREEELSTQEGYRRKDSDTSVIISEDNMEKIILHEADTETFVLIHCSTYKYTYISYKLFLNDFGLYQIHIARKNYVQWMIGRQFNMILHSCWNMHLNTTFTLCGYNWLSQSKIVQNVRKSKILNGIGSFTLLLLANDNTRIEKCFEFFTGLPKESNEKRKVGIQKESIAFMIRMDNHDENQALVSLNYCQANCEEIKISDQQLENEFNDYMNDSVGNCKSEGITNILKTEMQSSSNENSEEVIEGNSENLERKAVSIYMPLFRNESAIQDCNECPRHIKGEIHASKTKHRRTEKKRSILENCSLYSIETVCLKKEEKFHKKNRLHKTLKQDLLGEHKKEKNKKHNQCSLKRDYIWKGMTKLLTKKRQKKKRKLRKWNRLLISEIESEESLCSINHLNQSLCSVGLARSLILDKIDIGRKLDELAQETIRQENKQKEEDLLQSSNFLLDSFRSPRFIRNLRSLRYFTPEPIIFDIFPGNGLYHFFQQLESGPVSREESMKYELVRFASLGSYSGNGSAVNLARHGFYHDLDHGPTATRCYSCGLLCTDWEYFDDIQERHRILSPHCPHLSEMESTPSENVVTNQEPQSNENETSSNAAETPGPSGGQTSVNSTASVTSVTNALQRTHLEEQSLVPEGFPSQPTEDRENSEFSRASPSISRAVMAIGSLPRNVQTTTHGMARLTSNTDINNTASGARSNDSTVEKSAASSQPSNTQHRPQSSTPALGGAGKLREINQGNGGFSTPGDNGVYGVGDPRLVNVERPKHGDYRTIDSRTASFTSLWPGYLDQTPTQMAEAGFFYAGDDPKYLSSIQTGVADFTRCFACGGGLRNWEAGDDPCLEHTRWYPRCEYMNKLKGTRYVEAVSRRQEQHLAEQRRRQQQLHHQRHSHRQSNNTPPDPLSTPAAAVLLEMGYTRERIREAIMTVRRNTGHNSVNAEQALLWILDQDERAAQSQANSTSSLASTTGATASMSASGTSGSSSASGGSSTSTSSNSTTTTASASASSTSSQGQKPQGQGQKSQSQGQNGSAKGSNKKSDDKKKADDKGGEKNEGKDSQKKGAEGEQPATGKKKKNGKKKGKAGGANGSMGGATGGIGGASGGVGGATSEKAGQSSRKEEEEPKAESHLEAANLDTQSLKAENQKLREMQTCKICMDRPVNMTLLPCGHLVCCESCVPHLRKCPICRKRIEGSVKTFMS